MYSRCWEDSYIPFSQQKWNCSRRLKTKVWSCLPLLPPCHRSLYFWPIAWELTPQASINTTSFLLSPLWPFHLSPVFNWTSSLARRWTRCSAVVWIESEDAGPCLARAFCKRSRICRIQIQGGRQEKERHQKDNWRQEINLKIEKVGWEETKRNKGCGEEAENGSTSRSHGSSTA